MEITTKEVVALLELNKRKAELEFKKVLLQKSGVAGKPLEEIQTQFEKVSSQAEELKKKIKEAGVDVIQPHGRKIAEFNGELKQKSADEIVEAMKTKGGDVYALLADRGEIIKSNFENRGNIAKISLIVAGLDGERKMKLFEAAWKGCISDKISVNDLDEKKRKMLAKLLTRTGVQAGIADGYLSADAGSEGDVALQLSDRKVWVSDKVSKQLTTNLELISKLNPKIQLKTAERQIRPFSEEEEKEFAFLQGEYLRLLKEQDDLLREYDEEESIAHSGS